jgi:hypothetical protein
MIMIWRRRRRPFLFSSLPRLLPRSIITPHGTTALSVMSPCCQYHPHHHKQQPHCVTSDYAFHGPVMMDDDIPQTILLSRLASSLYDTLPFFSLPTTILWVSHTKKTAPHDCADGRASSGLLWRFFFLLGFCDCNASLGFVIFTTPGLTDGNLFDDDDDMNTLLVLLLLTHE